MPQTKRKHLPLKPVAVCRQEQYEKLSTKRFGRGHSEGEDPITILQEETFEAILEELGSLAGKLELEEDYCLYLLGLNFSHNIGTIIKLSGKTNILKESKYWAGKFKREEPYYCVYLLGLNSQNDAGVMVRLWGRNNFHWELASKELAPKEVKELQRYDYGDQTQEFLTPKEVKELHKHWYDGYQYVDCPTCNE